MKNIVKVLAVLLLVSIIVGAFSGCAQIFYCAKIFDSVGNLVLSSFKESNPIYSSRKNPNAPRSRSFIITDKASCDTIFDESAFDIDFDREVILLCTFSNCYIRRYYLDKISIQDGKATVYVRMQRRNIPDSVVVYQRWIAERMRKVEIETVEFYEWKYDVYNGGRYEKI